jgi:hypothetical protein
MIIDNLLVDFQFITADDVASPSRRYQIELGKFIAGIFPLSSAISEDEEIR